MKRDHPGRMVVGVIFGEEQCICCDYPVDRLMHVLGCEAADDEDFRSAYGLRVASATRSWFNDDMNTNYHTDDEHLSMSVAELTNRMDAAFDAADDAEYGRCFQAIRTLTSSVATDRRSEGEHRAEYQRKWRASKGARTGALGRPVTSPCGTPAAYKRHKRNGEPIDDACRAAYSVEQRRLYRLRRTA